jgi:hypothetical protein
MTNPENTVNTTESALPAGPAPRWKSLLVGWPLVATLFFTAIGAAVVFVVGSIAMNFVTNKSLIPPPSTLARYDCAGGVAPFAIFYLHGTDRVRIKSANGILEGTVSQNRFDWGAFASDTTMLGFTPPADIALDDSSTLRFGGASYASVVCTITKMRDSGRREIVQ